MSQQITPILNEQERISYEEAFNLFDQDRDGSITQYELGKVFAKVGLKCSEEDVNYLFNLLDLDKNGRIDFSEFLVIMTKQIKNIEQQDLDKIAYKIFGKNSNQLISAKQIKLAMQKIGISFSDQQAQQMIKQADSDGDGFITFPQYQEMMRKIN